MDPSEQLPFVDPDPTPSGSPASPSSSAEDDASLEDDASPEDQVAPDPAETASVSPSVASVRPSRSFQASAGIQGRQFAEQCDTLLSHYGFELRGRRVLTEVGVEIDQEAVGPNGTLVWFEYKGSVQGNRPGLRRTDTLKKAIANGALLRSLADPAPYVVVTSHLPEAGSGAAMLGAALRLRYFADVVCLYDTKATARLGRW